MKGSKKLSTLEKSSLILAIFLLVCLLPLPYGFYTLIRLATAIIAGCWAYLFFRKGKTTYAVISCAVLLLFQPFIRITLDRLTWNVVDVILVIIILFFIINDNRANK